LTFSFNLKLDVKIKERECQKRNDFLVLHLPAKQGDVLKHCLKACFNHIYLMDHSAFNHLMADFNSLRSIARILKPARGIRNFLKKETI
jgi:hypothetical protein